MNIWLKFGILYLIPIVSFALAIGTYLYLYGKSYDLEKTIINFTILVIVIGFTASSILTIAMVMHFMPNHNYLGIVFSVIAWFFDLLVVGLYLVITNKINSPL